MWFIDLSHDSLTNMRHCSQPSVMVDNTDRTLKLPLHFKEFINIFAVVNVSGDAKNQFHTLTNGCPW